MRIVFPDCSTVIWGASRLVPGTPRLVIGAPRLVIWCSRACRRHSQVLPGAPGILSGTPTCSQTYQNHSHGTLVPVIRDHSYSVCQPDCPLRVWDSPEIDASKFTLHILPDTPGGFQWLKYILLMVNAVPGIEVHRSFKTVSSNLSFHGNWSAWSIFRYEFWRPKHKFSQNLVKSSFKALGTQVALSKCGTWVSGSCRPACIVAEQNLSFEIHPLILQPFWQSPNFQKLFLDFEA